MPLPSYNGLRFNGANNIPNFVDIEINSQSNEITFEVLAQTLAYPTSYDGLISNFNHSESKGLVICPTQSYIKIMYGDGILPYNSTRVTWNVPVTYQKGVNHYVVTYADELISVYLNGVLVGTKPQYVDLDVSNTMIGKWSSSYHTNYFYRGLVLSARQYNRALTASEVFENYLGNVTRDGLVAEWNLDEGFGTTAYDSSGNGNHGTIVGATWIQKRPARTLLASDVKPFVNLKPAR